MSSSTSLISGLASGIDWRSMIDDLIAIEHRRVDIVENKKTESEQELAEWLSFNSDLLAFRNAAESIMEPEDFALFTASMSSDSSTVAAGDLLSISTDTDAAAGAYDIKITAVATSQKLSSNPFTSLATEMGSGYAGDIVINGTVIRINATDSLSDVAGSINAANTGTDPSGVTASIVSYSANDHRLILTSDATGSDGITLLNGSSANLVQKFGWKDSTDTLKTVVTGGAQSDLFSSHNVAIKSLMGLQSGAASTGSLTVAGTAVSINLSTDSLEDIADAIDAVAGVSASVISEEVDGETFYRIHIQGTQTVTDENNILNTLGILDFESADVAGVVSDYSMTEEGAHITAETLLVDIDGYFSHTVGDAIELTGTDTNGNGVGPVTFTIDTDTTVGDLLDDIESRYGDVIAYVTADGKIRVDDTAGSGNLSVVLTDSVSDGELAFTAHSGGPGDPDDAFGATATDRKREIIAGSDASLTIDGVTVTSESNVITDVIEGVTLDLLDDDADTTVTMTISRDVSTITSNIENFVDQYNSIMGYINTQFSYDVDAEETGGILFGDGTLSSVKSDLTSLITQNVWGVDDDFSLLSLAGITMDNDLLLSIDDAALMEYLQTNFTEIKALFVGQGSTSSSTLAYVGHTTDSEPGAYDVHINRAATRGTETGTVSLTGGGAADTLTITQGSDTAEITITAGMDIDSIINAVNEELETEYTQVLVGNEQIYSDAGETTAITSETTWDSLYNGGQLAFEDDDVITFSGTARGGASVTGNYTIDDVAEDTVQGLLSAIEDAFSSDITATIDTSGRIVITDKYMGTSRLSLDSIADPDETEFFGTVDVSAGAGDGSQTGRYAISVTASKDAGDHLVLENDDYGSSSFTISQDTADSNYDHIIYGDTAGTTATSNGTVFIDADTQWNDIEGASLAVGDKIAVSGFARDGSTPISGTYTIDDLSDPFSELLTAIESAYSAQGTTVDAFLRDGTIYVEDETAGSSSITLTLTPQYDGGGSGLDLGTVENTTERDLDLGLINAAVTGCNVAGTIGGEEATGTGRLLRGATGNTNTDGLVVKYTGTADNSDAGSITLTVGVAEQFYRTLFYITDPHEGYVAFKQESLNTSIDGFEDQIDRIEDYLSRRMETMINEFVAMEITMSKLQNQSSWLAGQINAAYNLWGI